MAQIFTRVTGDQDIRFLAGRTGAAIAVGDLVTVDNDTFDVFPAATDKIVGGIAMDALGAADTSVIRFDMLHPGDKVRAKIAAGTGGALTEKGAYLDIATGATGLTVTESNNDFYCTDWDGDAAYVTGFFTTLMTTGPATATVTD